MKRLATLCVLMALAACSQQDAPPAIDAVRSGNQGGRPRERRGRHPALRDDGADHGPSRSLGDHLGSGRLSLGDRAHRQADRPHQSRRRQQDDGDPDRRGRSAGRTGRAPRHRAPSRAAQGHRQRLRLRRVPVQGRDAAQGRDRQGPVQPLRHPLHQDRAADLRRGDGDAERSGRAHQPACRRATITTRAG